jgi:hypothetical protein
MAEIDEACERFTRIAHLVGNRVFGVDIAVEVSGDRLIFVDGVDEPITVDGEEMVAATPEEIAEKYIPDFPARALRAAGMLKFVEIEGSRTP